MYWWTPGPAGHITRLSYQTLSHMVFHLLAAEWTVWRTCCRRIPGCIPPAWCQCWDAKTSSQWCLLWCWCGLSCFGVSLRKQHQIYVLSFTFSFVSFFLQRYKNCHFQYLHLLRLFCCPLLQKQQSSKYSKSRDLSGWSSTRQSQSQLLACTNSCDFISRHMSACFPNW